MLAVGDRTFLVPTPVSCRRPHQAPREKRLVCFNSGMDWKKATVAGVTARMLDYRNSDCLPKREIDPQEEV